MWLENNPIFSKLFFLRYILYFIQRLNLPREVKNIFKNSKNSTLILSSPGWWNYDQFFFSEAKILN